MIPRAEFRGLKLFDSLPDPIAEVLCAEAESCEFGTGDYILRQHDEARFLYILLSGTVEFLITVEGVDNLFVGMTSQSGALLGWSIVREPHRYTATIRCTEPCRVLRLPRGAFAEALRQDPRSGYKVLQAIAAVVADRLQDALGLLSGVPKTGPRRDP